MSDDRIEQEEPEDQDVEAHKKKHLNDEGGSDELNRNESDDFEAHKKKATEEPASEEDSDDVEAHRKHH